MTYQHQYKGEIQQVSPKIRRDHLKSKPKCFVGISLSNPSFLGAKFEGLINFIANRHHECTFLLGDYIHRLTLQISEGLAEDEAKKTALQMGEEYIERHRNLLEKNHPQLSLNFIKGSHICHNERVQSYLDHLRREYHDNSEFKLAVNRFSGKFIARAMSENELTERAISLSSQYVLEELAETCFMIHAGHEVLIYPGSLAIFEQIADGHFPHLPEEFNALINVSVRLKKRKQLCQLPLS
ncbi:tRNA-dependent cyclodipeptide synthase [Vibrio spartinae]|uniref:Cyclodipeptide synthase n=1 Tax=Vibrio spartinae TaxID=1918945 RepID=A0A1N6MBF3_9VIBR|nr:tRNA-dependent cyclodipeptide synthase [Vibrio spartinae]QMV17016.1 hypothetical protein Vspart_04439 [Vibrio spartinae]SIO96779.1 hypothetical protein VSP9026_04603 [Vibrio spartinae]